MQSLWFNISHGSIAQINFFILTKENMFLPNSSHNASNVKISFHTNCDLITKTVYLWNFLCYVTDKVEGHSLSTICAVSCRKSLCTHTTFHVPRSHTTPRPFVRIPWKLESRVTSERANKSPGVWEGISLNSNTWREHEYHSVYASTRPRKHVVCELPSIAFSQSSSRAFANRRRSRGLEWNPPRSIFQLRTRRDLLPNRWG